MNYDAEPTGGRIDDDCQFLGQFSRQCAQDVFPTLGMTGRQAELTVVIARSGTTHQQDPPTQLHNAVHRHRGAKPIS